MYCFISASAIKAFSHLQFAMDSQSGLSVGWEQPDWSAPADPQSVVALF